MGSQRQRQKHICIYFQSFPGGSDGKESTFNEGDLCLIPELERSLDEGMATHSSILARRIPWTEEPGGLQSMGLQIIGHNQVTNTHTKYTIMKTV